MVNVLIFELIYESRFLSKNVSFYKISALLILLILFSVPINYNNTEKENIIKVVGIQSNIDQNWIDRYFNKNENLQTYLELSNKSIKKYSPDLIIWPEYVFTHPLEIDYNSLKKIKEFSYKNNISLILGSIKLENISSSKSKRYNSLYIFKDNNFTIYNAYEPVKVLDDKVISGSSNSEIEIKNVSIGLAVCYEENFPHIFNQQITKSNSKLFLVIGNQYFIKNEHGLKLTSLNSNLRAAESNKYVFRLETAGLSTVIDNTGKNIAQLDINKQDILYYEIPVIDEKTFYSNYSNIIELLFFTFSISVLIITFRKK